MFFWVTFTKNLNFDTFQPLPATIVAFLSRVKPNRPHSGRSKTVSDVQIYNVTHEGTRLALAVYISDFWQIYFDKFNNSKSWLASF